MSSAGYVLAGLVLYEADEQSSGMLPIETTVNTNETASSPIGEDFKPVIRAAKTSKKA
jgi:hypothetical protein